MGDEPIQEFCLWMLACLGLPAQHEGLGIYRLDIPEPRRPEFGGASLLRFICPSALASSQETRASQGVQVMAPGSKLFDRLARQFRSPAHVNHSVPRTQPASIHELAPRLLGAYKFDSGRMHLGGCTLEERPLVRLTYADPTPQSAAPRLRHLYQWPDGGIVDEQTVEWLGLQQLVPRAGPKPRTADAQVERWIRAGVRPGQTDRLLAASIVWCKYAEGKIVFASGGCSVEVPFAGWAQMLVDARLLPPPYRCAQSGRQSYQLATTDDGRITVAEAIAVCEKTGERVIESELETCAVSGRRMRSQFLETCPLTNERVASELIVECGMCHERVSPSAVKDDRCAACRRLQPLTKDDPRLARVLGEYPGLDRWKRWRFSETARAYVLIGRTLLQKLLIVVDKHTMDPLHMATAQRLAGSWHSIPTQQRDKYLR